ncbi:MAG: lipopolysaccharide biosynthesis protein [Bacteroidales bacterium]|nr:lipopolysaccharide biosynthesis protein [Candidatus Cryptobacteroides onthequi]
MANPLKQLAKDTAIYGLSSIVGRFLNYLLVPLYTYKIASESGGYGIVSNLYAYSALLFALLTFGMETTFFRFAGKEGENDRMVYSNALRMVGAVGLAFVAIVFAFLGPISGAMGYGDHPGYIGCFAVIGALDAFQAIMFGRLRQQHRPLKFMALKMTFIGLNILMNLFIFLVMPKIPACTPLFESLNYGVGLIFYANLLCTALVTLGFIPELKGISYGFDRRLAGRMLGYSWPLLLLSLVGILPQAADKILFPYLMPGQEGMVQLGIYGACVKIAMIMTLLTQAFRYAYEPIVFNGSRDKNSPETLAMGMKYFIIFTLLAYLAVLFYMPVLRRFVQAGYWEGLKVIPIVMMAEIFMGVYFNLSFWYKLSDQTWWGAVMSAIGAGVMILVNVLFVPEWGYMACAWGGFAGYGIAMLLSYFIGQKKYPIRYDLKSIGAFALLAAVLYLAFQGVKSLALPVVAELAAGTVLLIAYMAAVVLDFRKGKA